MIPVLRDSASPAPVFILGVERCGSTWLANIFDSSPDVLFFMEPFADFAKIFPGFPDRLLYIDTLSPFLESILEDNINNLYPMKYPLFDSHTAGPFLRAVSNRLMRGYDALVRTVTGQSTLRYIRCRLLNLNRSEIQSFDTPKNKRWNAVAIKELRLNFKIGPLHSFFPGARFIVVIRNPLVQLNSVMTLFSQNSLQQLKQSLFTFLEYAQSCDRFSKYQDALTSLDSTSLFDRLVAYWFLNYDVMLEDLKRFGSDSRLVRHEDLCTQTEDIVKNLFSFSACEYAAPTKQYIEHSSRAGKSVSSPLDTTRNSKTLPREAFRKVDDQTVKKFFDASRMFWSVCSDEIRSYRGYIEKHVSSQ